MTKAEPENRPSNANVVAALNRLSEMLKSEKQANESAPTLSHYRELPAELVKAYDLLMQGAQLVHSTSTKYTLVGKVDMKEQTKLGFDLQRGCEFIGAATHLLLQDGSGCSRSVRQSALRASLSILINVIHLAESFEDHTAMDTNVGAQKTGAVWESCDTILKKLLPQGNRNAMRRELFTWTRDCNDTMEEFQEMIDLGAVANGNDDDGEGEEEDMFGGDEQYSEAELPVAVACLALLKCSRGTLKLTLETCESLGSRFQESKDENLLNAISQLHDYARAVGEGVTDFGSLMYPPMLQASNKLEPQARMQIDALVQVHDFVLSLEGLPGSVTGLANTLRTAVETRRSEFVTQLQLARQAL